MAKIYVVMSEGCIIGVYTAKKRAFDRAKEMEATGIEVWQDERYVETISDFT